LNPVFAFIDIVRAPLIGTWPAPWSPLRPLAASVTAITVAVAPRRLRPFSSPAGLLGLIRVRGMRCAGLHGRLDATGKSAKAGTGNGVPNDLAA
jgi:hypothetical protein